MPKTRPDLADHILDKALELGETHSWEEVRLHSIAGELGIPLNDIRNHFAQKDDLVEAWFDRADKALLGEQAGEEFLALSRQQRLYQAIMTWLDALAPHRRLTREMLAYKLEFGHIHLQVLGLMRISRTVQWFRETARQDTTGMQRILEECSLTSIYLMTFTRWMFDDSPDSRRTRRFLERALHQVSSFACGSGTCFSRPAAGSETRSPAP